MYKINLNRITVVSAALFVAAISASVAVSISLYSQTQQILEERLKDKLISVVSTAALSLSHTDLMQVSGPDSVESKSYKSLVEKLQLVRNANENVKFAYILKQTENPDVFIFLADADSLDPTAEVDLNGDGIINDEDALATPGDEYDVSEIYALRNEAPNYPTTDANPESDQWGATLSAYAPIKDKGQTIGILGLDIEVSDYIQLIQKTIVPFLLFTSLLLLLLTILWVQLVKLWKRQVDTVQELDRQKDELLGLVSHQLAAPVSAIRWYIEMLLDGDLGVLTPEQQEQLKTVQGSTQNLNDLVSMILDVSRVQLGRVHIEKQEMDLDEFFKEIFSVVEPKAIEKKVEFTKNMPASFPKAMLDKRYTRMTIENLMTNAIKYTPKEGKVTVTVGIADNMMRVVVKDTGFGIPLADQKNIFGKMFRASNVRNSSIDGNGFGLYVAKGAVESQGGKIWFESAEGKGTTFYVTLPLAGDSSPKNS